ncbi:MAG: hypothetical protein QXO40_00010 [Candidatus Aenigmatarchaeota archaeon]
MIEKYRNFKEVYTPFWQLVNEEIEKADTLKIFYNNLSVNLEFKFLKSEVRKVLQDIYREIANHFNLRPIPVYLSDKYKIKVLGRTFLRKKVFARIFRPQSIVIFYLMSSRYIDFNENLREVLLVVQDADTIANTLIHESVHAFGIQGHGSDFYDYEEKIVKFLKSKNLYKYLFSS